MAVKYTVRGYFLSHVVLAASMCVGYLYLLLTSFYVVFQEYLTFRICVSLGRNQQNSIFKFVTLLTDV